MKKIKSPKQGSTGIRDFPDVEFPDDSEVTINLGVKHSDIDEESLFYAVALRFKEKYFHLKILHHRFESRFLDDNSIAKKLEFKLELITDPALV